MRNASGDIYGRYLDGVHVSISHAQTTRNSDTIFYSSTSDYIYKNTAAGMRSSLDLLTSTEISSAYVSHTEITNYSINPRFTSSIGFGNDTEILKYNDGTNQTRNGYWTNKDGFQVQGDSNLKSGVVLQTGNLEIDDNAYIAGILGIGDNVKRAGDYTIQCSKTFTLPSYFVSGEYLEIGEISATGSSRNYTIVGELILQSGAVSDVIEFEWKVRSNTLPAVDTGVIYTRMNRYYTPITLVTWYNSTTGVVKLAVKNTGSSIQNASTEFNCYMRGAYADNNYDFSNVTEYTSIPAGFAEVAGTEKIRLNTSDEGSGNGLDADLLDGQHGAYYLNATNFTNQPSPVITLTGDVSGNGTLTNLGNTSITATVANNSHTHTWSNITNLPDPVITLTGDVSGNGTMTNLGSTSITATVANNSHSHTWSNITSLPDPVITLTGDVSGSGTMTDLGSTSITATVANNSHTHTWANITNRATTLAGYGITDAATSAQGTKADTAFGWGNHAGLYLPLAGKAADSSALNGYTQNVNATGDTIVLRDADGDITGRYIYGTYLATTHSQTTRNSDTIFYSSTDNFIRKNTAAGMRSSLSLKSSTELDADYVKTDDKSTITLADTVANVGYNGLTIDHNISGAGALTADRTHVSLLIDTDSSATGGDTNNEHRVYGIYSNVLITGDSDIVYGVGTVTRSTHSTGTITNLVGLYSNVQADNPSGTITNTYGTQSIAYQGAVGTASNVYGGYFKSNKQSTSTHTSPLHIGLHAEVEIDAGTITTARAVQAYIDRDAGSIGTGTLYYGEYQGTLPSTAYGIYIASAVENYFAGDLTTNTALNVPAGTSAAPSITFAGDANTGFYGSAGTISATLNGTREFTVNTNGLSLRVGASVDTISTDPTSNSSTHIMTTAAMRVATGASTVVTANTTLNINKKYFCDGGITVTLPASATAGYMIQLAPRGDWTSSNLTVARNGHKIEGLSENLTCDTNVEFLLIYKDATTGWKVVN